MNELLQYWPTKEEQDRCIHSVAETLNPSVFFAVHQPMKLKRIVVGGGQQSEKIVNEEQFFKEFLVESPSEGRLVFPVFGASGVGKTHFIRWLDLLIKQQNNPMLEVVVISRSSGLRRVLTTLVERFDGAEFQEIAERLKNAREHLGENADAQQLKTNVVIALEAASREAGERIKVGKPQAYDEVIRDYGNAYVLPAIIDDPQLRPHFIGDEENPGVFWRLAAHVTKSEVAVGKRELHEFVSSDLSLDNDSVINASKSARNAYRLINTPAKIADATRVLNNILDDAKRRLLEMGGPSLVEIFIDLRRAIFAADPNRELILLIEDFAVLSGLQGSILEMVVHEATREGNRELCTMRTVLAFTEGYSLAETVLTRANVQWKIDEKIGDGFQRVEQISELIGAYLNAARLGEDRLIKAAENADFSTREWLESFQAPDLSENVVKTLDAFGTTKAGYPLFPFNKSAVKLLSTEGSQEAGELLLNPRHIIQNVIWKVLQERPEFEKGSFPSSYFGQDIVGIDVANRIPSNVPEDVRRRYRQILYYWGNQAQTSHDAESLPREVYEGFRIDPLDFRSGKITPVSVSKDEPSDHKEKPQKKEIDPKKKEMEEWEEVFRQWNQGTQLLQTTANKLRGIIAEAMYQFIPWDAYLLKFTASEMPQLRSNVYLPNSGGQTQVGPDASHFITVALPSAWKNSEKRAKTISTLRAIVRVYDVYRGFNYVQAEEDSALIADFLNDRMVQAVEFAKTVILRSGSRDPLPNLVRGLWLCSRVLGIKGTFSQIYQDQVNALISTDVPGLDLDPEGSNWQKLSLKCRELKQSFVEKLLLLCGARQGGGMPQAIDVSAIVSVLKDRNLGVSALKKIEMEGTQKPYHDFCREVTTIQRMIGPAVSEEKQSLLDWRRRVVESFGENIDKAQIKGSFDEFSKAIIEEGKLRVEGLKDLEVALVAFMECPFKLSFDAVSELTFSDDIGKVLHSLSKVEVNGIIVTDTLIDKAEKVIKNIEDRIGTMIDAAGSGILEDSQNEFEDTWTDFKGTLDNWEGKRTI